MNTPDPSPIDDETLSRSLDGLLSPEESARLEARLASDPVAAARRARWAQQREALVRLYAETLHEAPPPGLVRTARTLAGARHTVRQLGLLGGLAAGVVLAFGAGWVAHGQWLAGQPAAPRLAGNFAREAAVAHAVYQPEVRHPVEVGAAEQAHLVQWLSRRLGRPLKLPQLGAQGFELVGGRLLPGQEGARAQFMYQDASGNRLTLYLGALGPVGDVARTPETAFRFAEREGVASFYWVDQGFGYAMNGTIGRARLLQIARAVHEQL